MITSINEDARACRSTAQNLERPIACQKADEIPETWLQLRLS
jgi:hypothetical protein